MLQSVGTNWVNHPWLKSNPELMSELKMISKIVGELGFFKIWHHGFGWDDAKGIWDVWHKRFKDECLIPTVQSNGGYFPHMNKTEAIKEFLARGFVHEDDAALDYSKIYIKSTLAPLV